MSTLYRSPNVIIDRHEWHVAVIKHSGRIGVRHYWRPLSLKACRWLPVTSWRGPKPKGLSDRFAKFKAHVAAALASERARCEAATNLRGPETAASLANGMQRAA